MIPTEKKMQNVFGNLEHIGKKMACVFSAENLPGNLATVKNIEQSSD
jgi:hypothetical protein